MTPTPNAVERCKAVPIGERSEMSRAVRIDAHEMVYVTDLWKAFDTLLAENARLASEVRAGDETRIAALEEAACATCPWCWNHRADGANWSKARRDSDTNRWVHLAQGYPPRLCTSDRIRDLIDIALKALGAESAHD